MKLISKVLRKNRFEIVLFFLFLIFSILIMWKTFRVSSSGNFLIASKVWSDFAATIPLIRSFSLGNNYPPQYPIFSGPPIRYHFLFFLVVGTIERLGIPIDWALNSISTISFFFLLLTIYHLGKSVFQNKLVGMTSVMLFLFNGSLGFLEFFKNNPLSSNTFTDIVNNRSFASFGPYDGKIVSAFWNLNIFTNQRHLAIAYATFLLLVLLIYNASKKPKYLTWNKTFIIGLIVGLFPFMHMAVFGMIGIFLIVTFIIYPKLRLKIFTAGLFALVLAIPQILYIGKSQVETKIFSPGYLIENLTVISFIKYWFFNLGLTAILAPIGLLLANKNQRKILLPFLVLFIVGNLFQFSPEIAANHKFFNLFAIGANTLTAYYLVYAWGKNKFGKAIVIPIFLTITLTGIIDFFPIINDDFIELEDYPNNSAVRFIIEKTPKDSTFLNSSFLYHPASLAGRKIYLGWPYFPWSAGYDTRSRSKIVESIYTSTDKNEVCHLLKENNLDYFTVQPIYNNPDLPNISVAFFEENFQSIYRNKTFSIYKTSENCET